MNTWTTRDGQEIPISELSDSHLMNIAKMMVRVAKINHNRQAMAFLRDPFIPDRIADEIVSNGYGYLPPEHWHMLVTDPRYDVINTELKARGVSPFDFEDYHDWVFDPSEDWQA